jgi:hypothetical protein
MGPLVTCGLVLAIATSVAAPAQTAVKPEAPVPTIPIKMSAGVARLDKPLDSRTAKAGDTVTAKLTDLVILSDGRPLPRETTLFGHVVAVQSSQNGSDSKLVLLFNEVLVKGKPPLTVKVTIQGLRMPPIPGPEKTYPDDGDPRRFAGLYNPHGEGIKDTSVPGVSLDSSVKDSNSGTITSNGRDTQLPLWTQLRIAIVHLPSNAVVN